MSNGGTKVKIPSTPKVDTVLKTVSIPLPVGMTQEAFLKSLSTFNKNVITGKAKGKADMAAYKHLRNAHREELRGYRIEEWKKAGLDPRGIK